MYTRSYLYVQGHYQRQQVNCIKMTVRGSFYQFACQYNYRTIIVWGATTTTIATGGEKVGHHSYCIKILHYVIHS